MSTKAETIVTDRKSIVELWCNSNGYPDYMIRFFSDIAEYAAFVCGEGRGWLSNPEDVASVIISFDWLWRIGYPVYDPRLVEECYLKGDIRPRGSIFDLEYFYVLDVSSAGKGYWGLSCYEFHGYITAKYMQALRKRAARMQDLPSNIFTHVGYYKLELNPNIPDILKPIIAIQILADNIK
ncbi:MAG: hypothetical protein QXE50_05760 [Nitrososphaerota archaeon]